MSGTGGYSVSVPKVFRRYEIERDELGMPTKMIWLGDFLCEQNRESQAEIKLRQLAEWNALYGKKEA